MPRLVSFVQELFQWPSVLSLNTIPYIGTLYEFICVYILPYIKL